MTRFIVKGTSYLCLWDGDTYTHIRTEVILRNQACVWFNNYITIIDYISLPLNLPKKFLMEGRSLYGACEEVV